MCITLVSFVYLQQQDETSTINVTYPQMIPHAWEHVDNFNPLKHMPRSAKNIVYINSLWDPVSEFYCENVVSAELAPSVFPIPTCTKHIPFPNPNLFVAGNIHNYYSQWDTVLQNSPDYELVTQWIKNGVDFQDFLTPFHGSYQGVEYQHDFPPARIFNNALCCKSFTSFIAKEITEKILSGAVSIWGKVGFCEPPHIVSPITIEPTKPRLCIDMRYLNCFMKDTPFHLDTLIDVPRLISQHSLLTKLDDKSGYDHVLLNKNSRYLAGFQWDGWYFCCNTLPFGFKNAAFIYHTLNSQVSSYLRGLHVNCLLYIDDRLVDRYMGHMSHSQ